MPQILKGCHYFLKHSAVVIVLWNVQV